MQGCCAAVALAERGMRVTIFDRNAALLSRTATANEGKVHLGYMYAGDPSLATAKTMIRGALAFAPFFERHFGSCLTAPGNSVPTVYAVHRDSQHSADHVAGYLATVHRLVQEAGDGRADAYFGRNLQGELRAWSRAELEAAFDGGAAVAAFDTPELAINPVGLGVALRAYVSTHPRIELRLGQTVTGADCEGEKVSIQCDGEDGTSRESFDHVVNALWEGRLALNVAMGLGVDRPWLHRLKYGVFFRLPRDATPPPSVNFVLGPFGEVVNYGDGLAFLTWYPESIHGISRDLVPPDWPNHPDEPLRSRIVAGTLRALADIVPALRGLDAESLPEAWVSGGVIVAWGETDIYDPNSELHRRYDIGITSADRFHSVDPGKLTMAPYFAEMLAERISQAA
jgi:glycine/D-amino acid oxidase-like deaminating enzyme